MADNPEISPQSEPEKTGTIFGQEKKQGVLVPDVIPPNSQGITECDLTNIIRYISDKSIKGDVAFALLAGNAESVEKERNRMRIERDILLHDKEIINNELQRYKTDCSVLKEKLRGTKKFKIFQQSMSTIGALISGGSISHIINHIDDTYSNTAIIALIAGVLLILFGMFYQYSNGEDK